MKEKEFTDVRLLKRQEAREAALLQMQELPREFLSRMGVGFLARYYRAFVESPHATAVAVADDQEGRVDGVFIATFNTGAHYSYLVRRHGLALAGHAILQAFRDPSLASEFLRTRSLRYARGVLRSLIYRKTNPDRGTERVGFPTYIAVRSDQHSRGIGGKLFRAYEEMARKDGIDRLELVTRPAEQGAGPFFVKLGYKYEGERISRSGERYALYAKSLKEGMESG